jgi:hypothetical protein
MPTRSTFPWFYIICSMLTMKTFTAAITWLISGFVRDVMINQEAESEQRLAWVELCTPRVIFCTDKMRSWCLILAWCSGVFTAHFMYHLSYWND